MSSCAKTNKLQSLRVVPDTTQHMLKKQNKPKHLILVLLTSTLIYLAFSHTKQTNKQKTADGQEKRNTLHS